MNEKTEKYILEKLQEKNSVGKLLRAIDIANDANKDGVYGVTESTITRYIRENSSKLDRMGILVSGDRLRNRLEGNLHSIKKRLK